MNICLLFVEQRLSWCPLHQIKYKDTHKKLPQAWEKYEEYAMTTNQLLRTANHIVELGQSERAGEDYCEDEKSNCDVSNMMRKCIVSV